MIEKFEQSAGNILGYRATGTIREIDYAALTVDVEALLQQYDTIGLHIDLEALEGEEMKAWRADTKFGHEYRKKIAKMAIVGDKKWQETLTVVVDPLFCAREAEFFHTDERDAAWERL